MMAILFLMAKLMHPTHAFPHAAGSCVGGRPAVGGSHLTSTIVEDGSGFSLSSFGLQVRIGGHVLPDKDLITTLATNQPHSIEIVATQRDTFFRGFLLRLGSTGDIDTINSLKPDPTDPAVQVSEHQCVQLEGVGGLTHTTSLDKTAVKGTLHLPHPTTTSPLVLDVTVVVRNSKRHDESQYYYSRYYISAQDVETWPSAANQVPPAVPLPLTLSPKFSPSDTTQLPTIMSPPTGIDPSMPSPVDFDAYDETSTSGGGNAHPSYLAVVWWAAGAFLLCQILCFSLVAV